MPPQHPVSPDRDYTVRGLRYEQGSGTLSLVNGEWRCPLAVGYAGVQGFINDPDAQCRKGVGPLPRGHYKMRVVRHHRFARPAIRLDPEIGTEMCGRSGFYIHGDNDKGDRSASSGCIILDRGTRKCVSALIDLGFDRLSVVL